MNTVKEKECGNNRNNVIPEVPSIDLYADINGKRGLKKLARWIARYTKLKVIHPNEFSPIVRELLTTGVLAKFEPFLEGYTNGSLPCGQEAGDDDYERYEFAVKIDNFVDFGKKFATLYFFFLVNDKCNILLDSSDSSINETVEQMFNILETERLSYENHSKVVTWQEADVIISKYIRYMRN